MPQKKIQTVPIVEMCPTLTVDGDQVKKENWQHSMQVRHGTHFLVCKFFNIGSL